MKRFALFLLLCCATAAHASTAVTGLTVRTHRSLSSVAVMVEVAGDYDTTATVRLFNWWETRGQDDSGMVLVRRVGKNIYHGRILHMQPGRVASFYVEANDGGTFTRTAVDTVSCSQVRPDVATGPVFYVDQATGSDSDNGTTPALAKATIAGGLAALAASTDSGAYGGVIVYPGEYHERVDLTFGRDGKPRFLKGNRANRDSTIICGANEWGEGGETEPGVDISWVARPINDATAPSGVYKAFLGTYGDSISSVIIGWGEYLHRQTSLAAIFADSTGAVSQNNVGIGSNDVSGWFLAGDTVYVRRANRAAPPGTGIHFGYRKHLIAVGGRNWSVRNLTIRYGGGEFDNPVTGDTRYDPGVSGDGIIAGRYGGVASGLVVDSCLIYGNVGLGIYAVTDSPTQRADSVTVANSVFDGLTIGSMTYADAKGRTEEDANAVKVTGSHSNIFRNTVRETHNGFQVSNGSTTDSTQAYNTELYGNNAETLSDDAYELDSAWGVNLLVMGNRSDLSGSGISLTTMQEGPVFVFYNTFTRFNSAGAKLGDGAESVSLLYHNTFASKELTSSNVSRAFEGSSGGNWSFVTACNNIFSGRIAIAGPGDSTGYYVGGANGNAFNYNMLDSASTSRLISWDGTSSYIGFDAWQAATGHDANSAYGDPKFNGPIRKTSAWPKMDVRLKVGSPAYRTGRKIPGVNSGGLTGNRYLVLPHMGSQSCVDCWWEERRW